MIVVDASVLVDVLLGRPAAVETVVRTMRGREHEALHAPELIEPETLNALRRLVAVRSVTAERAGAAVRDLATVRLVRYPHGPFRERVWELRDQLSAYDATYLALAEALPDALLLVGDAGLAMRADSSLGPGRVVRAV